MRGQVCAELDQAFLPPVCCQSGAAPAFHSGLQPGQLPAQAGLAQGSQGLVIAQHSGEADKDRRPDCAPRPEGCLSAS